jgi:8-oxo-dGTP diphosphatase
MSDLPRLVVAVFVFLCKDHSLLLVKQSYGGDYWSLPGGVVEPGESIDQAAIREVKEETGLEIRLTRLVGLYSKPGEGALAVTFEGECIGGLLASSPNNEISQCCYFPLDQLPEGREHFRQRVEDFKAHVAHAVFRTQ